MTDTSAESNSPTPPERDPWWWLKSAAAVGVVIAAGGIAISLANSYHDQHAEEVRAERSAESTTPTTKRPWRPSTTYYTPPPSSAPPPAPMPAAKITRDGIYLVGDDIEPGTWRTSGGTFCSWQRLSDLRGEMDSVIAIDVGEGPRVVTILASDRAFKTDGCGSWSRIEE